MPAIKKKTKKKVEREPVTPISKTIPNNELREFVGKVPNLLKIESVNVNKAHQKCKSQQQRARERKFRGVCGGSNFSPPP